MRFCFTLFALLAVCSLCHARPAAVWTYEKLVAEADLVVIATPTETKDMEKTVLPNIQQIGADGERVPFPAVGVETTFEVLAVLKGDEKPKTFVLYHLRETKPENVPNGPQLIAPFEPKKQQRYLLFLRQEADGRFVSVTGPIDAAVGVKDLGAGYP
jgi:hypothetical protein